MKKRMGKESLVRILMAAVCNTDKEIVKGYRSDFQGVMGHELKDFEAAFADGSFKAGFSFM